MVPTSIFAGGEKVAAMWELYKISIAKFDCHEGGFHLHLLVFPFVYQHRGLSTLAKYHRKVVDLQFCVLISNQTYK